MDASPRELLDAQEFLNRCPCHLVGVDKIQLAHGLHPDQISLAKTMKPALLGILLEARRDESEERAGILEYEAGFSRREAERRSGLLPNT